MLEQVRDIVADWNREGCDTSCFEKMKELSALLGVEKPASRRTPPNTPPNEEQYAAADFQYFWGSDPISTDGLRIRDWWIQGWRHGYAAAQRRVAAEPPPARSAGDDTTLRDVVEMLRSAFEKRMDAVEQGLSRVSAADLSHGTRAAAQPSPAPAASEQPATLNDVSVVVEEMNQINNRHAALRGEVEKWVREIVEYRETTTALAARLAALEASRENYENYCLPLLHKLSNEIAALNVHRGQFDHRLVVLEKFVVQQAIENARVAGRLAALEKRVTGIQSDGLWERVDKLEVQLAALEKHIHYIERHDHVGLPIVCEPAAPAASDGGKQWALKKLIFDPAPEPAAPPAPALVLTDSQRSFLTAFAACYEKGQCPTVFQENRAIVGECLRFALACASRPAPAAPGKEGEGA